jgi:hypothetical protein
MEIIVIVRGNSRGEINARGLFSMVTDLVCKANWKSQEEAEKKLNKTRTERKKAENSQY